MMENFSRKDLKEKLKGYVDRMIRIRSLSSPGLSELTTADTYSSVLRDNFKKIGELAEENRKLISGFIDPLINSEEPLDSDIIETVRAFNDELLDAVETESIDLPMAALLSDRLIYDAEKKGDRDYLISILDKEIENCYLLLNIAKRALSSTIMPDRFRERGITAFKKLMAFLDKDVFLTLSKESRKKVMINSRYGAALYECLDSACSRIGMEKLKVLEDALKIAEDPFYKEALPDYDWKYHLFRIYEYGAQTDTRYYDEEMSKKVVFFTEEYDKLWKSDPEYFGQLREYTEVEGRKLRGLYASGRISPEEYRERLYKIFKERNPFDNSTEGNDTNIEFPGDFIRSLTPGSISEQDLERVNEMYQGAIAYMFFIPKMGLLSATLDPYAFLISDFIELPGNMTFEEMGIRSIAALHPPTYIHSVMVAFLSRCLAGHLMRMRPELFTGICGCPSPAEIEDYRDKILEFIYHAALCHDFGKLMIIDTIFVYGRKLFDFEFDLIKQHPDVGADLLEKHDSTREYSDIARGHHRWYDGTKGYPDDFDVSKSPLRTLIDIVTIADCMDAATDSVGRSYRNGKTFEEFEKEVKEGAGTRYAPWATELLEKEKIRDDIEYLLSEGRTGVYRETYLLLRSVNDSAK